jgi:hypothetical protein
MAHGHNVSTQLGNFTVQQLVQITGTTVWPSVATPTVLDGRRLSASLYALRMV